MQFETRQECQDAISILENFPTKGLPKVVKAALSHYARQLSYRLDELPTAEDIALYPEAIQLANLYAAKRGYGAVQKVFYQEHILRWVASTDNDEEFTIGRERGINQLPACIEWLRSQVGNVTG